ncbi:helix-turn-helix transcriptional regulator [Chromatiaceae bacterium AAb-1]|nr:helix-turn-helix transcriptional regulator [Chromatiaceae bacterium AAb-1]
MKSHAELKKELLQNPAVQQEYNSLADEFELISILIAARTRSGLTQKQLAEKMGTTQSVIARLESGKIAPSVTTLKRYAAATGSHLKMALTPAG